MDGRAFDDLARLLAADATRRRAIAGLGGAALALLGRGRLGAQQPGTGTSNCAAITCLVGNDCCENCGGICVPAGTPCTDDLCGGEPCNTVTCGPGEFCCNESCSICAPLGGVCTQQLCDDQVGDPDATPCNQAICGPQEFCCNWSCSICAPLGGACTQEFCGEGPPPPTCQTDADCGTSANPCESLTCQEGSCVAAIVACAPGFVCCGNGTCCPEEVECRTAADCPPDPTGCNEVGCAEGRCVSTLIACDPAVCVGEREACGNGVACCEGLTCETTRRGDRICRAEPAPAPAPTAPPPAPGAPPAPTAPAAPAAPSGGTGVVRLPSTGRAGDERGVGPWSAALAVAAAGFAALTGRRRAAGERGRAEQS